LEAEVEDLTEELYNYEEYIREGSEKQAYLDKLIGNVSKLLTLHVARDIDQDMVQIQLEISATVLQSANDLSGTLAKIIEMELGIPPKTHAYTVITAGTQCASATTSSPTIVTTFPTPMGKP
jgi:hypothetical protein